MPRLVKTWRDAEEMAAEWTRYLGFADAAVTQMTRDGGIDVRAARAVAQVKMEGSKTPASALHALFGVAAAEGKAALFFSLAGYRPEALAFAEQAGMALFVFAYDGTIEACSTRASSLLP